MVNVILLALFTVHEQLICSLDLDESRLCCLSLFELLTSFIIHCSSCQLLQIRTAWFSWSVETHKKFVLPKGYNRVHSTMNAAKCDREKIVWPLNLAQIHKSLKNTCKIYKDKKKKEKVATIRMELLSHSPICSLDFFFIWIPYYAWPPSPAHILTTSA